ncbi:dTDP-fucosamine acetyltransferase [Pseudidiomarina piscicola]|uniref:dTDP-fucosamine acetyltransferase n=1 Tax=Pseudidiomarina piscicola TaxID=2614830 RepID=A0A6S6WR05_9GAMM|nr:GNAT family N-acetyltransferase/peptidase C39 family protein [Pseudidiomarina piscicola]CAB0150307.1 dTDP-fucosamine acetyltransferase [Pseudidiomarina piscicola]VZT39737.1 dTDP-fucosamine acetyltransferase [Pseudomonas aeruginosa]
MVMPLDLVRAKREHLAQLDLIELTSFATDRISHRSFKRFIDQSIGDFYVALHGAQVLGYCIVLYRQATQLARLYSLAVLPEFRQRGVGTQLLRAAENAADEQHCLFLRLEVKTDNHAALAMYHGANYHDMEIRPEYYEDASDAVVLQKLLPRFDADEVAAKGQRLVPYRTQTTEFTCGPASLLMAMAYFECPSSDPEHEELEIWREATTIFMTSGHGGCGPHGLARAALRRGLQVVLHVSHDGPLFMDSVRSDDKKQIMARIQEADIAALQAADVTTYVGDYSLTQLRADLAAEQIVVALISTYVFDASKAPHWVVICAVDENYVYINDPDQDALPWQSAAGRQYLPIPLATFRRAFGFGRRKQKAVLVLSRLT